MNDRSLHSAGHKARTLINAMMALDMIALDMIHSSLPCSRGIATLCVCLYIYCTIPVGYQHNSLWLCICGCASVGQIVTPMPQFSASLCLVNHLDQTWSFCY